MIKFSLAKKDVEYVEAGRHWYDTKAGIAFALVSLKGLNHLIKERHDAGYDRDEELNEFYILGGRYSLDTCGNCGSVSGISKEIPQAEIPSVLTKDEFFKFLNERTSGNPMISCSMDSGNLPDTDLLCPHCGQGWTIDNCHDVVVWNSTKTFSLANFIGRTLEEVKLAYYLKSDAIYRMQFEILIRNDRFIDLSPKYSNPERDWQKNIIKNENGWVGKEDGITDEYVIQEDDEGFFNVWKYFHKKCNSEHLAVEEEQKFRTIFEQAGFKDIRMSRLPNGYCLCEHCAPWFNVNTEFGMIMIGWRKRVINIDWSSMYKTLKKCGELPKVSISSLFNEEDVTKGRTSIHAWGLEKAQDYLNRIYGLVSKK